MEQSDIVSELLFGWSACPVGAWRRGSKVLRCELVAHYSALSLLAIALSQRGPSRITGSNGPSNRKLRRATEVMDWQCDVPLMCGHSEEWRRVALWRLRCVSNPICISLRGTHAPAPCTKAKANDNLKVCKVQELKSSRVTRGGQHKHTRYLLCQP